MNRFQWMIGLSTMALLMGGCAGGDRSDTPAAAPTTATTPAVTTPAVTATTTQPAPTQPATQQQGFSRPVVPPTPVKNTVAVPGLVQPTNATARLPQIPAGRQDPFAAVVTTPVVVPTTPTAVRPVPQIAPVPKPAPAAAPAQPTVALAPPPAMPPATLPELQPSSSTLSTLPLPPAPPLTTPLRLADAVEVTGVLQVGNTVSAIVKVPNEASDRYVRAGEYLANGQVLVKRIELGTREEPIVVLEQNGVEVIRAVGAAGNTIARAF